MRRSFLRRLLARSPAAPPRPEQPQTRAVSTPPRAPPQIRGDLIGLTAGELVQRLRPARAPGPRGRGPQAPVPRAALHSRRLSLSAARRRRPERVTHVDARLRTATTPIRRPASPSLEPLKPAPSPTRAASATDRVGIGNCRPNAVAPARRSPLFPAAIRQLRTIRLRPIRLIGEPANISRNAASSSASRSASRGAASSARGRKALLAAAASAKRFHGQTARQSSQP